MAAKLRAVLWDMDGTLVNSEPLWEIATYELSEEMGRRLTPELRAQTVGGSFANTLQIAAEHAGISLDKPAYEHFERFMVKRMQELLPQTEIFAGVIELLGDIQQRGIPNFIVTNTSRELAEPVIDTLGAHYFAGSLCGDEVHTGKPHPLIYRLSSERLRVSTRECLVFEDSYTGMTAATRAGCVVVAAPGSQAQRPPEVHEIGINSYADITFNRLEEWFNSISQ
ncbi:HAD family phosphatase [Corynebacterium sp. ES2794-CONJ1]|uniref:HAD family hydrolase n=1 Tax=unclassified Corynebacterium TaxID=2624378 RepID=UPI0021686585|nr:MULTISPECIES: HAD family phosphatase [unclassified Corynebacterium]MCS4489334.1 HAD family phosphatase [Corynebacterium sp. ES2775-CONJ]MCS4530972.1 HAD family phosphatase [Corynebacterium sp. ES2730-CONJ]MCU9518339.1 HAD family phosphatase [Corynebacterium sp. ES2794-CONJ1]